ncbi:MAG: peroxide stress protein YaaA, partial [Desulfobulbaceae bacterium]|nr:peroxide stress protein YaaA [Candidatus Desulfobia pelagia]
NFDLDKEDAPLLINLASNEYFKAIKPRKLHAAVLNINFKEIKNGKAKTIAIFAKQARGMMTEYILKNKIEDTDEIKKFTTEGYSYSPADSDDKQWTFCRRQPPSK